jgi:hypothetical protein
MSDKPTVAVLRRAARYNVKLIVLNLISKGWTKFTHGNKKKAKERWLSWNTIVKPCQKN